MERLVSTKSRRIKEEIQEEDDEAAMKSRVSDELQGQHEELAADPSWRCDGEMMREAVQEGNDAFVLWHLRHCIAPVPDWLLLLVVSCGQVKIFEHLVNRSLKEGGMEDVIKAAVSEGTMEVIQWLHQNVDDEWSAALVKEASSHGRFEVLQWLHALKGKECTTDAMGKAAACGHLKAINWLHAHQKKGCATDAINLAAKCGHLEVLQWLFTHRDEECTTDVMDKAAASGHLNVVKWLFANRMEGRTLRAVDLHSSLEVAGWLQASQTESNLWPRRQLISTLIKPCAVRRLRSP